MATIAAVVKVEKPTGWQWSPKQVNPSSISSFVLLGDVAGTNPPIMLIGGFKVNI